LYVGDIPVQSPTISVEDETSKQILSYYQPSLLPQLSPRATNGDGNCCYRAVSLALYGVQEHHRHVRLLTAVEMLQHPDFYDVSRRSYSGQLEAIYAGPYDDMITAVTTLGGYAELMHLYGVSAAFRVAISSFMPPVGLTPSPYSRTIVGRSVRSAAAPVFTLMWTMLTWNKLEQFMPNHFVLLLPRSDTSPQTNSITDDENENAEVQVHTDVGVEHVDDYSAVAVEGDVNDAEDLVADVKVTSAPDSSGSDDAGSDSESVATVEYDVELTDVPAEGMQRLPDDTWLSTETVYHLLRSASSDMIHKAVPRGHKAFCYCVVDNQSNVDRRSRGQRRVFDDDCGAWNTDRGRMCVFPYIMSDDGAMRRVFLRDGKYCVERKCNGRRKYDPFDPQPDPSIVVRITRYYGICNADPAFKKRVTWFEDASGPSSVAVVEYHGAQPPAAVHGNAKKITTPYTRTPASTMDKVKQAAVHAPPKAVYNDCIMSMDIEDAPRNSQSVRSAKRYQQQKVRRENQTLHRLNFADEILQVMAMAQSDSFVRDVRISGDRVPCIVVYRDRQLRDIKSFCFDARRGSVLSFDKTFNLGSMYVTVSTYRNQALNRPTSGSSPNFFGPMFIHGQSDTDTYNYFFGRIASKLQDMDFQQLRLGLDDEFAMRKSLAFCFRGAALLACNQHLQRNTEHCARDSVGLSSTQRHHFVHAIFGDAGLTSCSDVASFDLAVDRFRSRVLADAPDQLREYFNNRYYIHSVQQI